MDSFKWINRDCVDGEQRKRKKKRKRLQELGRMVEKQLFFGFALGVCVCSILLAPTSPFCLFPSSFPSPSPPPSFDLGEDIGKWSEERKGGFLSMEQHRGGEMQMAWQTPILKVNVADFGVKDVEKMNKMLTTSIKRAYLKIKDQNKDLLYSSSTAFTANQEFYQWQMDQQGFLKMFEKKQDKDQVRELFLLFQGFCDGFLSLIGIPEEQIQKRGRKTHPWATYHEQGAHHLLHSHPFHSLSGVYYPHVPKGSGSLVFEDPRGPLPPFDNRLSITPQEGLLVIFPSWLLHQVTPTTGEEGRISIAFNIEGEWELTSSVSASFPVEM